MAVPQSLPRPENRSLRGSIGGGSVAARGRAVVMLAAILVGLAGETPAAGGAEPSAPETSAPEPAAVRTLIDGARRIVFLGDSITASGQYVSYFNAWLLSTRPKQAATVIDAGLPSETVSGLSEDGHAGGQFPRPDLAERLDRVLAATKPDLVIACYGMNCGIYQPLDEQRFERYRQGMTALKAAVERAGAKFIVVTPPIYDDQQKPLPFKYNEVLDRYSQWLVERRGDGWTVIDLHGPMSREVERRRADDPKFTFDPDGVHPNEAGHWFIARQLIAACGDTTAAGAATPAEMLSVHHAPPALLPLIEQRVGVLRDAYVGAAGHKRPGIAPGLPLPEADKRAADLTDQIQKLLGEPAP